MECGSLLRSTAAYAAARLQTVSIIIHPCPATRSSTSSTISPAPAATFSSTTTGSGAAVTPTAKSAAPRARFAARLRGLGVVKGDKVVFWCENRPEWIVAFWGCLLGGVVVVPVDYRASPEFLARVAGSWRQSSCSSARTCHRSHLAERRAVWKLHELDWETDALAATPPRPPRRPGPADQPRRRRRDHLHVGRDGRAQGRRHHAPQRPGEHRAGRTRGR